MSAKHTEGPWVAAGHGEYEDYDGVCRVIIADDLRVAVVLGYDNEETNANTRLIESAPDMKDVLKQLEAEYRPDAASDEYYPTWALFDAVMKKAGV